MGWWGGRVRRRTCPTHARLWTMAHTQHVGRARSVPDVVGAMDKVHAVPMTHVGPVYQSCPDPTGRKAVSVAWTPRLTKPWADMRTKGIPARFAPARRGATWYFGMGTPKPGCRALVMWGDVPNGKSPVNVATRPVVYTCQRVERSRVHGVPSGRCLQTCT